MSMMERDDPRLMTELHDEEAEGRQDGPRHVSHEIRLLVRRYRWLQGEAVTTAAVGGLVRLGEPPAGHIWIVRHLSSAIPTVAAQGRFLLGGTDNAHVLAGHSGGFVHSGNQWIYIPEGVELLFLATGQPVGELVSARALVAVAQFETALVELAPRCERCGQIVTSCLCVS